MTIGSGLVGAVRCAAWARAEGLDPIGSAGSYRGFLLLEVPLPWPRDVSEMPEVAAVADLLAGRGLRVQALVPAGAGPRRAIAYLNPTADHFSGFARREVVCGSDLRGALTALLAAPAGAGRDLLVCTHGGRDVCCGSRGMDLAMRLGDIDMPDGLERWRTSHTGGHRFAPTFVVLPEGTAWAYADTDLVDRVLRRRGDCADVLDRYRGCAGLGGPAVQALEREVLREVGWALLDQPRWGETGTDGTTRLFVDHPAGRVDVWEGRVEPGRDMPVPDCGQPIEAAKKSETEWVVADVRRR